MKSSLRSDEIFGMPPQMKLNPSSYPDEVGFHHEVISSTKDGFIPSVRTDLVEKNPHLSYTNVGSFMVEVRGVEPLSKNLSIQASPSADSYLRSLI